MKLLEYIPLLKACVVAGPVSGLPALLHLIPIFDCQDGIIPPGESQGLAGYVHAPVRGVESGRSGSAHSLF